MLNICICDDEKIQRSNLKDIIMPELELKGFNFLISECENGENLIKLVNKDKNCFDIIFLDIELTGDNGIKTAKKIRDLNDSLIIIFVTGFAEYVFNGYDVKALNYILKPYKKSKIIEVLNEALKQIDHVQNRFFAFQLNSSSYKIHLKDIIYFASNKRKLKVVTKENTYEFYGKLDDIEKNLPNFFVRIHQRYLINFNFVLSIENNYIDIKLEKLPISRQRYQTVMIAFAKTMLG